MYARQAYETAQEFMERDMRAQAEWLAYEAQGYGYTDLDDLFGRAPAIYAQLALTWRQTHPLPVMGPGRTPSRRQRVTARCIHMLLVTEGITFSEFVLDQRLTRAHRMSSSDRFEVSGAA